MNDSNVNKNAILEVLKNESKQYKGFYDYIINLFDNDDDLVICLRDREDNSLYEIGSFREMVEIGEKIMKGSDEVF